MSERGVFAVDRGIWDHPIFADEPLTEREAWTWLIAEASFKPRARNVGGKIVRLERGQLAASVRFMGDKWQWSKSRVDRFLKRLKTETMIETDAGTGLLIITINNYNKFQRVSLPDGDSVRDDERDTRGTVAGQQRDKTEDTEYTESTELISDGSARAREVARPVDDWPPDYRDRFWDRYPHKVGKPKALAKLDACRKRRIPFNAIMDGLDRYIRTKPPDRQWLNPETFINQERWNDQPAPVSQGNPDERSGSVFANSRPQQSGSSAVLAGVAAAAERRARERVAAGQQRPPDAKANAAAIDDPDFFGAR